jgi:hypothetical protein
MRNGMISVHVDGNCLHITAFRIPAFPFPGTFHLLAADEISKLHKEDQQE